MRDLGIPRFRGFLSGGIDDYYDWTAVDINGPSVHHTAYSATVLTNFAVDFIANHEATRPNEPWFVFQAYNSPHFPNQVPPANLHTVNLGNLQPGTVSNTIPNYKAMIRSLDTYAIKDTRHKLLSNNGQWALYDLETDPLETTNLYASASHASVRAGLKAELDALKARATAGCFQ